MCPESGNWNYEESPMQAGEQTSLFVAGCEELR